MKKLLAGLLLVASLGLSGCETEKDRMNNSKRNNEIQAVSLIQKLVYVKDPRTGFCFAYSWDGSGYYGGPSLATVPCKAIPPQLLTMAK